MLLKMHIIISMSDDSLAKIVDSLVEERKSERKFKLLSRVFFVILL